jgi:lysophospholipase L1-like esterase
MIMSWSKFLFLSALPLCSVWATEPAGFQLHDGDTVVFYGDSITNQRLYTVFTETYVLTRFPGMRVGFVHSGWSGDRVTGGGGGPIDVRLDRDVFAFNPTVITIMLGMNDAEYRPYDEGIFSIFSNGYRHILDRIKAAAPQARVTLLEPSPYDDVTRFADFAGGYNAVLLKYGKFVRELGRAKGLTVADVNAPVIALLKAANADSTLPAQKLIPDRVHPSAGVHLLMAEALLRAWGAPPVVSVVEIDGAAGTLTKTEKAAIDSLVWDAAEGFGWTETDQSLPMPIETDDDTVGLALRYSDFMDALNREILKISGLPAGRYSLEIDDQVIGEFDASEFAGGINLAAKKTPMSKQAQTVLDLTYRRNHLRFARMRMVEDALRSYHPEKLGQAVDTLKSLEDEVLSIQRAAALPKPHRYRVHPVSSSKTF